MQLQLKFDFLDDKVAISRRNNVFNVLKIFWRGGIRTADLPIPTECF